MARLTTAECNKLVQDGTLRKIPDGGGLYLFVQGEGRAYWTYQYRDASRLSKSGKPAFTSKGLGSFPDTTPKQAREALEAYRVSLRSGTALTAPGAPRQARAVAAGKSFTEALDAWLAANETTWAVKGVEARAGPSETFVCRHGHREYHPR